MRRRRLKLNFKRQVDNVFFNIKKDYNRAVKKASIAAWKMAVESTPAPPTPPYQKYKRTGRLRAGWKLNTGKNVGLIPAFGSYGKPATPVFSFNVEKDKYIQLFNNIPYAGYVETGGLNTVPRRMLFRAKIKFKAVFNREIRKL